MHIFYFNPNAQREHVVHKPYHPPPSNANNITTAIAIMKSSQLDCKADQIRLQNTTPSSIFHCRESDSFANPFQDYGAVLFANPHPPYSLLGVCLVPVCVSVDREYRVLKSKRLRCEYA